MNAAGAPRPPAAVPAPKHTGAAQLFARLAHAPLTRAAEPVVLRKINSETDLAVQLLTALRGSPAALRSAAPPALERSDESTDGTVDGDVTDSSGSRGTEPHQREAGKAREHVPSRAAEVGNFYASCIPRASETSPGTVCGHSTPPSSPKPAADAASPLPGLVSTPSSPSADTTLYKYTREERQEAVRRFKEKKRLRTFKKTIRYDVRKRLADTRPRYKGRFSKPPAGESYDDGTPGPPPLV